MNSIFRISRIVLVGLLILILVSASNINSFAQEAKTVHQLAIKGESFDFYKTQAELWLIEIEKDIKNEDAWYNYYKACRYGKMMFPVEFPKEDSNNWLSKSHAFKDESEIIALMNKNIPNTFTTELLNYNEALFSKEVKNDRTQHLFNAYKINPYHPEIQDEMVSHYEMIQDLENRKKQNQHWFRLNSLSSVYLNYAYNMFMSIDEDAILFTGGDNDTYSAWMLQDVMQVGEQVTVINSSLICKPDYRAKIFSKLGIPEITEGYNKKEGSTFANQQAILKYMIDQLGENRSIYVALTTHKELYQSMDDDFYLTGLARQYSKTNMDEIALIKRNFHKRFLVDYLREGFVYQIAQENLNRISINYIPVLLKLYKHYEISEDDDLTNEIKYFIKQISTKTGPNMIEWYNSTFEEKCKK